MSEPSRSNESKSPPESASTEPGAPKRKGFITVYGFSEETLRRFAGSTVVSVPRVSADAGPRALDAEVPD
jgi:hypothetical protein